MKEIIQVHRQESARRLAAEFVERYEKKFIKAVEVFRRGIEEALVYTRFPTSHHLLIRSTNELEKLFREVKRRTRVVDLRAWR
jgi:transposase-like protein